MRKTLYNIPILINFKGEKGSLDLASPRNFHCFRPKKIFVIENDLYFPIGIVKMRKDASFWRTMPLKFQSKWSRIDSTFRKFQKCWARMTHFGENTEFIEDYPVNLMLPSDLTKTVSILYYGPPKFQSYEDFR